MDEDRGLSDRYRKASPWPVFVALGLALSEVGVFVGIFPVAVFGLLLFGGSVAGILTESGYAARPWPTLLVLGAVLSVLGVVVIATIVPVQDRSLAGFGRNGVASRMLAVVAAGVVLASVGGVGTLLERTAT